MCLMEYLFYKLLYIKRICVIIPDLSAGFLFPVLTANSNWHSILHLSEELKIFGNF